MINHEFGQGQINMFHDGLLSNITESDYPKIAEFLKQLKADFALLDTTNNHKLSNLKIDLDDIEFNYSGTAIEATSSMSDIFERQPAMLVTMVSDYHHALARAIEIKKENSRFDLSGPILLGLVLALVGGSAWWALSFYNYSRHDSVVSVGRSAAIDEDLKEPVHIRLEKGYKFNTPTKGTITLRSKKPAKGNLNYFSNTDQQVAVKVVPFETKQVSTNSFEAEITSDPDIYVVKMSEVTDK
jgi:hypothetical protein